MQSAKRSAAVSGAQHVDFVKEMSDWLATLGRVDDIGDADSRNEVIGIKQRLMQMRDPRIDPEYFGRLMSECSRFRRDFEMRRKVLPEVLHGSRFKARKRGAVGPLRKLIRQELKRNPAMKNAAL